MWPGAVSKMSNESSFIDAFCDGPGDSLSVMPTPVQSSSGGEGGCCGCETDEWERSWLLIGCGISDKEGFSVPLSSADIEEPRVC